MTEKVLFDQDSPLDRIAGESRRANDALRDYYGMGTDRTLKKLLERYTSGTGPVLTRRFSTLKEWSTRHGWQARVDRQKAIDDRLADVARAGGIADHVQREMAAAMQMYDKGRELLSLPIVRITKTIDGQPTVIEPVNANEIGAGRQLIQAASAIGRLALGMPTENKNLNVGGADREITLRVVYGTDDKAPETPS